MEEKLQHWKDKSVHDSHCDKNSETSGNRIVAESLSFGNGVSCSSSIELDMRERRLLVKISFGNDLDLAFPRRDR